MQPLTSCYVFAPKNVPRFAPVAAETFVAPSSMASGFALPDSMEEAAERFGWIDLVFRQFLGVLSSPLDLLVVYLLTFFVSFRTDLLSNSPYRPARRDLPDAIPAKPPHPHDRPAAVTETPSAPGASPPRLASGEGSPPF